MSYEIRFRELVLSRLEAGLSQRKTAKLFGISRNTLADWLARKTNGEGLAPRKRVPEPKKIRPGRLAAILRKTPDIYGCEIAAKLGCSRAAVCYALRRHGYTLKKKPPPSGSATSGSAKPSATPSPAWRRENPRMWTRQG